MMFVPLMYALFEPMWMLRESPLQEETGNDHSNAATQVVFSGHNENINSMNQSESSLKSWGIGFSSNSMKFAILL